MYKENSKVIVTNVFHLVFYFCPFFQTIVVTFWKKRFKIWSPVCKYVNVLRRSNIYNISVFVALIITLFQNLEFMILNFIIMASGV